MKALGRDGFFLNRETVSLRCVEQLVDEEQTAALGYCLLYAEKYLMDGRRDLRQVVDELEAVINAKGLEALCRKSLRHPLSGAAPKAGDFCLHQPVSEMKPVNCLGEKPLK